MRAKLFLFFTILTMSFGVNAQINSVAVVGEAAGGWPGSPGNPGPEDIHQMTSVDGENWELSGLTLTTFTSGGGIKFRANNDWTINWGSAVFPAGTGTQGGANIQCIAGTYDVTFNSITGEYNFSGGTPLPVVKLVGTAVTEPGGLVLNISGPNTFSVSNSTLVAGFAQFEVDGVLFGGTFFPFGGAFSNIDLIPVPAAFFSSISFNIATGGYIFSQIPPVSIVGDGVGGWPGSAGNPGPIDTNQLSSTDGVNFNLDKLACTVGPAKFRQDNSWAINWGNAAFPSGTATQDGDNIAITAAGTYDVRFNRVNGEYSFSIPTIALVGSATPAGWPTGAVGEIDAAVLNTLDGVSYFLSSIDLVAGECKFRTNNAWNVNFGAAEFPFGVGIQDGANIVVPESGAYSVSLNRVTGAYSFVLIPPFSIVYNSPNVFTRNVAIANLNPTIAGGVATSYSISPALPSGLSINTLTGVISGTPTAISATATYTVTATNTGGSTSFGVVITVNDVAPSALTYSSPNVFTIGSTISDLIPTVLGAVLNYSISPSLPDGLSFDTTTGIISGTPTTISETAFYTVTATNLGGSVSFDVSITVEELLNSNENQFKNISIYPNPFLDIINVNGSLLNSTFTIYSVDGKLIQEDAINGSVINIKHVPSGIYFLKLSDKENRDRIFKVIKK